MDECLTWEDHIDYITLKLTEVLSGKLDDLLQKRLY